MRGPAKGVRTLIGAMREDLHQRAERIRTHVYAEEVERQRDGLPPADRGLALAWADALDSMAGSARRP